MDEVRDTSASSAGIHVFSDRDRGAVYLAEDQVARVMGRPGRAVRVGAAVLVLPEPLTFGNLPAISSFLAGALANDRTLALYPDPGPVEVVPRRGFRQATYSPAVAGRAAQIRIPAADNRGRWALAQSVVVHELAHHLSPGDGHGAMFRRALLHLYEIHVGRAAAELLALLLEPLELLPALPAANPEPALRRVGALLAKAAATSSDDEAQAYLAKATALAAKHSIDLAVAALSSPVHAGALGEPTHRMLTIGRPGVSLNKLLVSLYLQLAHDLGVRVDVGPRSAYVLSYGLPGDLDRLEAVYATASQVMASGAGEHVTGGSWRGQQYAAHQPSGSPRLRPVTALVARNAYCIGFIDRVTAGSGHVAGRSGPVPGRTNRRSEEVALALRRKDLVVLQYHQATTRARGSWQASGSAAGTATGSRRAGQRAGEAFGRTRIGSGGPRALGPG